MKELKEPEIMRGGVSNRVYRPNTFQIVKQQSITIIIEMIGINTESVSGLPKAAYHWANIIIIMVLKSI
jgi:hypothetical protein